MRNSAGLRKKFLTEFAEPSAETPEPRYKPENQLSNKWDGSRQDRCYGRVEPEGAAGFRA